MKNTVISTIVENDLCIGCGVCAAICPEQSLEMRFNKFGEYNPVQNNACSKECGLCLKVCPFANGNDNEDIIGKALYGNILGIQHRLETGYYFNNYVGYASTTRARGASGGMATWLLATLLIKGIVDYVVVVVPNNDPEKLFKFAIFSDSESVDSASGAAYYPVELSEVLKEMQMQSGKYAVIGLPCFVKAIRLAQKSNKELRERIVISLGLTCGQLKSKHFTEYTSQIAGVTRRLNAVRYRGKSQEQPANNYYYSFTTSENQEKRLFWNDGISEAWVNRWFTPNACNFCDDVFGECADVTFMDAWLPEYSSDYRGTSLVLVRSKIIQKIIEDRRQSEQIVLNPIPVQEIIRSQEGLIQIKKYQIGYRLLLSHKKRLEVPIKRVPPNRLILNPFLRREIELKEVMRSVSKNRWEKKKNNRKELDLESFQQEMNVSLAQLKKWRLISTLFIAPVNIVSFMNRKIQGYLHG